MQCSLSSKTAIFVPIRGRSRGIPGKGLVPVAGHPLLWYTLEFLRREEHSERTFVVTDDDQIAAWVNDSAFGIGVIREPPIPPHGEDLPRALRRATQFLERGGSILDTIVCLQPTQPVRPAGLVEKCIATMQPGCDTVLTVSPPVEHPTLMMTIDETDRHASWVFGRLAPRQHFAEVWRHNGVCYVFRRSVFEEPYEDAERFWSALSICVFKHRPFPYVDIDDPEDLVRFEMLMQAGLVTANGSPTSNMYFE